MLRFPGSRGHKGQTRAVGCTFFILKSGVCHASISRLERLRGRHLNFGMISIQIRVGSISCFDSPTREVT